MPPKPNYGKVSASSTKVQTNKGAKVTTIVSSNSATSPDEPGVVWISIELSKGAKAGFDWGDGGLVNRVTPGGAASKFNVREQMRLTKVGSSIVPSDLPKKEVEHLLLAARDAGPYVLLFANTAAEASAAADVAAKEAEESSTAAAAMAAAAAKEAELAAIKAEEDAKAAEQAAINTAAEATEAAAQTAARAEALAAEVAKAEAEASAKAAREAARNGKVTIVYQMYADAFQLKDGALRSEAVDEEYCLSGVMPGCKLHLSKLSPEQYTKLSQDPELQASGFEPKYEREEPWGVFQDLSADRKYYLWVVQDAKEEAREKERMKGQWAKQHAVIQAETAANLPRTLESCSCIEGMPCMDPYICLDWYNRVAVAQKHGFVPEKNKIWKL